VSDTLEAAREFGARIEAQQWTDGVRIVVRGAMRAVMVKGSMDLEASWAADVYYSPRQRKPSFTYVAETPEKLLAELGAARRRWRGNKIAIGRSEQTAPKAGL